MSDDPEEIKLKGDPTKDPEGKKKREKTWETSVWGRYKHRVLMGVSDKDDYLVVDPRGRKNPQTRQKDVSDEQLRLMIVKGVLEKGFQTLYFYKGNNIDPMLTSKAQQMLNDLMKPGHVLAGYNVGISTQKMEKLESWRKYPLSQWFRDREDSSDAKAHQKSEKKAVKPERGVGKDFRSASGEQASDRVHKKGIYGAAPPKNHGP